MAIQGMNLPSIAGVLGFKDFTNQLNNANAGVRNAVGLVNDWAKMAAQNNQAEKQAQAQRDFTAEQNQMNRDFQQAQQNERFEHELGMFEKQQERQIKNEGAKLRYGLNDVVSTPFSDKTDTNAMTIQRIRNKVNEIKEAGPAAFNGDEAAWKQAIFDANAVANKYEEDNEKIKTSNKLQNEFKDFSSGDWRNKGAMLDWFAENADTIRELAPNIEQKIYQIAAKKDAEEEDYNRDQRSKRRGEARDSIDTADKLKKHNKKVNF